MAVGVALFLVAAYWGVTQGVRLHVDGVVTAAVGKPLPAFALADGQDQQWTPERLRGRRAVLHFLRSRCHSCDAEAPGYRALEARLPPDVVLLHVMTDVLQGVPPEETQATIAGKGFAAPVLLADAPFVDAFHKVRWSHVTPITYIVDRAGVIRLALRGRQEPGAIERALATVE